VAVAYDGANSGTKVVSGWTTVEPGKRACVVSGDLTNRNYYFYAYSDDTQWQGKKYYFYVDPQNTFSYDSLDPAAVRDVKKQGFEKHGFMVIDTQGAPSFLQQLE